MSAKREGGFKFQMFLGELPRPEEFQNDRWSEQDGFNAGVYREGEDYREPQQTFYKKYHNFFIFQAIFFIHTSKKLPR